jgi:hypothetical protein
MARASAPASCAPGASTAKSEPFSRPNTHSAPSGAIARRLSAKRFINESMTAQPWLRLRSFRSSRRAIASEPCAFSSSRSSTACTRAMKWPRFSSAVVWSWCASRRNWSSRCDSSSSICRTRFASAFIERTTAWNSSVPGSGVVMKRRAPIASAWVTTSSSGRRITRSSSVPPIPASSADARNQLTSLVVLDHNARYAKRVWLETLSVPYCFQPSCTWATPGRASMCSSATNHPGAPGSSASLTRSTISWPRGSARRMYS